MNLKYGIGCSKNERKSKELFLECLSKGSKLVEGISMIFGWGNEVDENKAFKVFYEQVNKDPKCEKKETSYFIFFLGRCYDVGTGHEKDILKAIEQYEKAVQLKVPSAMYNLGLIYDLGRESEGIQKDAQKAVILYNEAIKFNHLGSLNNLAVIYKQGREKEGIDRDLQKSIELYNIAIQYNHPSAIYNLAYIYHKGSPKDGVPKDIPKAVQYYIDAIKYDHPSAMVNLGNIYKRGFEKYGVKKDTNRALQLFNDAIKFGHVNANYILAGIYKKGEDGVEIDLEKSASLFFKAFSLDNNHPSSKKEFLNLICCNKIFWKPEYHPFWKAQLDLNKIILFFLLISKFRKESSNKLVSLFLVKGITINIVKFLCHLKQVLIEDN